MKQLDAEQLRAAAMAWIADDPDPATQRTLEALLDTGDEDALREHVGSRLQFGTAGLRGLIGPGPNRMNRALVRRVGAGLAQYLLANATDAASRGVVVGGDARHMSPEFVEDTARVLAGAGIKVFLYEEFVATPVLAFAVRHLGACAGVIVTASHNPPEYNGYKVYWDNGAQIVPPHDVGISAAVDKVGAVLDLELADLSEARQVGLVEAVPPSCRATYMERIEALRCRPELPINVSVVYTPMHGVGATFVEEVLSRAGATDVHVVAEQREPDGDFPTVRFPNPEEDGAMDLSLALARRVGAELVLANDPDADRLAVAIADSAEAEGYRMLSGNEIGCLLAHYLLEEGGASNGSERLVMTTIVSSRLLSRLAQELGAHYDETLTGFKWIANAGQRHHRDEGWRFVMGYEEALGYTVGDVVADKDGVSAALLFCEIAAWCKSLGSRLGDYLEQIYRRFGLYASHQHSLTLPGQSGAAKISRMMESFRQSPPAECGRYAVTKITDFNEGAQGLPPSNVLAFDLEGGGRVLVRPSGTEPKIKFYFELRAEMGDGSLLAAREDLQSQLDALVQDFVSRLEGDS
jgi:phosphomannomutase